MATVWIPALLRHMTEGKAQIDVPGVTVGEVVDALDAIYPGVKDRLCDAGGLTQGIAVSVDGLIAPLGLLAPVDDHSEIHFVPAVGGGLSCLGD